MANVADFQCYPILFNRSMKKLKILGPQQKPNSCLHVEQMEHDA